MQQTVVESLEAIVGFAESISDKAVAFRGLDDAGHELLPCAKVLKLSVDRERDVLDYFRLFGPGAEPLHRPASELEWMALGQHHGLATRLMDWTFSILVAAYFAVEKAALATPPVTCDSAIYALAAPTGMAPFHRLPQQLLDDPLGWGARFEIPRDNVQMRTVPKGSNVNQDEQVGALLFIPPVVSARIAAQSGVFLLPAIPDVPLEQYSADVIVRLRIPASRAVGIFRALAACGIHRQALFPDLDGIAFHANASAILHT